MHDPVEFDVAELRSTALSHSFLFPLRLHSILNAKSLSETMPPIPFPLFSSLVVS